MRVGAQWVYSKEGGRTCPTEGPGWLGVGYVTADAGGVLILVSLVLLIVGLRRVRPDATRTDNSSRRRHPSPVLVLAIYLVAVWAMTAKPD